MDAPCTHCGRMAQFVITYEDAMAVQTEEAACPDCKNARAHRVNFNAKPLSEVDVEF